MLSKLKDEDEDEEEDEEYDDLGKLRFRNYHATSFILNEYVWFLDLGSDENEDEGEDEYEAEEDLKAIREVTLEDIRRYNQMDIQLTTQE